MCCWPCPIKEDLFHIQENHLLITEWAKSTCWEHVVNKTLKGNFHSLSHRVRRIGLPYGLSQKRPQTCNFFFIIECDEHHLFLRIVTESYCKYQNIEGFWILLFIRLIYGPCSWKKSDFFLTWRALTPRWDKCGSSCCRITPATFGPAAFTWGQFHASEVGYRQVGYSRPWKRCWITSNKANLERDYHRILDKLNDLCT